MKLLYKVWMTYFYKATIITQASKYILYLSKLKKARGLRVIMLVKVREIDLNYQ
jgi:hypothetical protein